MFGILLEVFSTRFARGFDCDDGPVWKDAAISLKPVACGFIGAGAGARLAG